MKAIAITQLISRICSSPDQPSPMKIVDTSIGRGGDIKKYLSSKNKINLLMGLDIASNVNEAGQRFYYDKTGKTKGLFLQYDTSLSIEDNEGAINDKENVYTLLNLVLGKEKTFHKKYKDING